jgi:hypothetical protein
MMTVTLNFFAIVTFGWFCGPQLNKPSWLRFCPGCLQTCGPNDVQEIRPKLELHYRFIVCKRSGVPKAHEPFALLRRPICHNAWQEPLKIEVFVSRLAAVYLSHKSRCLPLIATSLAEKWNISAQSLKQAAHVGYLDLKSDIYKTRKIKRAPELIIKRTHTRARMTHLRFFGIWTTTQTSKECALLEKLTTDGRKTRTG